MIYPRDQIERHMGKESSKLNVILNVNSANFGHREKLEERSHTSDLREYLNGVMEGGNTYSATIL